ncbi:hypothetical protein HOLleu_03775 [Holothuria leucospilota]|uniref:Uncharacterized protein n=1 Tax=Holothuria leucospilota TaxID=206669 RepID=A0A9Q1HLZ9_HOLLE|nr:hypothetical protein HOLleu_03775 [Holothuria leucospilota]
MISIKVEPADTPEWEEDTHVRTINPEKQTVVSAKDTGDSIVVKIEQDSCLEEGKEDVVEKEETKEQCQEQGDSVVVKIEEDSCLEEGKEDGVEKEETREQFQEQGRSTGNDDRILQVTVRMDADGSLVEEEEYINAALVRKTNEDLGSNCVYCIHLNFGHELWNDGRILQVTVRMDADGSLVEEEEYINAALVRNKHADLGSKGTYYINT